MKIKNYKPHISNYALSNHIESLLFYLLILFLPTQLGKHYWPDFSYILGIRVDYLSPTVYMTDILVGALFIVWIFHRVVYHGKNSNIEARNSKQHKDTNDKNRKRFEHLNLENLNLFRISNFGFRISILLLLFLLTNILISGRILGGLYSLLKILEMTFVAYYTAKFITNRSVLQKVITVLGIGVVVESVLAIAQYFNQGSVGGVLYYLGERTFNASTPGIANASLSGELVLRPYGTFPHPNVLAGFLVVAMILVLSSLLHPNLKKEARIKKQELRFFRQLISSIILNSKFLIQATALVFGTIALILSMSRVAIALWIMVLILVIPAKAGIYLGKNSGLTGSRIPTSLRFAGRGKSGMKIFFIVAISLLIFSPVGARFTQIKTSDESFSQRAVLNEASIDMLKANPLFGVGLGNFLPTLAQMQKPLMVSTYLQPVHNIFLLVAAETGLIGLGFFTWFLWRTFKAASGKWQMANGIVVCFFAILVTGFFDHYWLTLQQGQLLFAFILGLCYNPSLYGQNTRK